MNDLNIFLDGFLDLTKFSMLTWTYDARVWNNLSDSVRCLDKKVVLRDDFTYYYSYSNPINPILSVRSSSLKSLKNLYLDVIYSPFLSSSGWVTVYADGVKSYRIPLSYFKSEVRLKFIQAIQE